MKTNTGGSAFPVLDYTFEANDCTYKHESKEGMTLRDYFAAKAMQSGLVVVGNQGFRDGHIKGIAKTSYEIADAMLAARGAE